jgi:hypothetical protein
MTPAARGSHILILDPVETWKLPARLVNMSGDGGLVCPGYLIATGRRVCLLFEQLPEAGWIDAEVVRSGGPGKVGIKFLSPLSPEFIRAATSEVEARRQNAAEIVTPYLGDFIQTW